MTHPPTPPLPIPDAAEVALALGNGRHAAALIAAAELRRFADDFDEMAKHWENTGDEARASVYTVEKSALHKRAIQLDGGAPS